MTFENFINSQITEFECTLELVVFLTKEFLNFFVVQNNFKVISESEEILEADSMVPVVDEALLGLFAADRFL